MLLAGCCLNTECRYLIYLSNIYNIDLVLTLYFVSRIYSEEQPGDAATALFIKKLSEEDAGEYRCTAVYASNQQLEARVDISVYSKFSLI